MSRPVSVPPSSPHVSWRSLRDPQPLALFSPASCLGSREVWAVCAAELGAGWAGGRKDICLLSCQGAGRGGGVAGLEWGCCESVGASACGPLDTQLMTWRPLRGQLAQPPALVQDILGQTAEVSTIAGPKSSPRRRTFSPCDSSRPLTQTRPSFVTCECPLRQCIRSEVARHMLEGKKSHLVSSSYLPFTFCPRLAALPHP